MKATTAILTHIYVNSVVVIVVLHGIGNAAIDPETAVGIWLFDDGKGDVAKDDSGHKNDGRLMGGAKWVKGKFGEALAFDGKNDYVTVPYSSAWDLGDTDFTFALWVLMDGVPPRRHYSLLGNTLESGSVGVWDGWWFMVRLGPEHLWFDHAGPGNIGHEIPGGFDYGNWHHYALTRDSQKGKMTLHYDGKPIGEGAWTDPIDSVRGNRSGGEVGANLP